MNEERVFVKGIRGCDECPLCTGLPFEAKKCLIADKVPWDLDPNVMLLRVIETYPEIPEWCKLPKKKDVEMDFDMNEYRYK